MNLTNQHIQNLKSQAAYCSIIPLTPSIPTSRNRLRWNEERDILNKKITHVRTVEFNLKGGYYTDDMCFNMILCPSGEFMMGAGSGINPRRREIIKHPFLLGETEVTQELFERVMGFNPSSNKSNKNPAEYLTWYDAVMFCNELSLMLEKKPYYQISNKIPHGNHIKSADVNINLNANGFRLPTEKEWEYAAKAGTNNKYAGCNTYNALKDYAWFDDNSNNKTHKVQTKLPNEWGFYDMSGNVFEWCWGKVESNKLRKSKWSNETYNFKKETHLALGGSYDAVDSNEISKRTWEHFYSDDCHESSAGFRIALSIGEHLLVLAKDIDNLNLRKSHYTLFVDPPDGSENRIIWSKPK